MKATLPVSLPTRTTPNKAHPSITDLTQNGTARHTAGNTKVVVSRNTPTSPPKQMQTPPRSDNELPQDAQPKPNTTVEQSETSGNVKNASARFKK